MSDDAHTRSARKLLITAGPTQEPIDSVRYIGNRSSGRLGVALADEAARRGWDVTLLLGPTSLAPREPAVKTLRFRTTADLAALLNEHSHACDVLVMAAAVADYRPRIDPKAADAANGKIRRGDGPITLELEPTPDLLARAAAARRPGQTFVGFALEPLDRLRTSALSKLERKHLDMVVANPLETMDSDFIQATVFFADGGEASTGAPVAKGVFAGWLLDVLSRRRQ